MLVVKMQLSLIRAISVRFSSRVYKQRKQQNGFLLQILISHPISMEINVKHSCTYFLPVCYVNSFIFLRSSFRTIYTCALNSRGGVEIDLTVTTLEAVNEELHDPIFKGRGILVLLFISYACMSNFVFKLSEIHMPFFSHKRILLCCWGCFCLSYNCTYARGHSGKRISC